MTAETSTAASRRSAAPLVDWQRFSSLCPALALAYPMLVWPLAFTAFKEPTGGSTELANITGSESNALNIVYFLAVGALAAVSAFSWPDFIKRIRLSPALLTILGYLALAGLSTLWALNTPISFRRFVQQDIIIFAALFVALAEPDSQRILRWLNVLMMAVVAINVLWLGIKPPSPLGVEGIYPQKNELGAAMIVATPFLIYRLWSARGFSRFLAFAGLLGALLLLVLSQSKTSLGLAVLVPLIAIALILAARVLQVSVASLIFVLGGFAIVVWIFVAEATGLTFDSVAASIFGDANFTGRTTIWQFAGEQAAKRPLFGYGFNSFWGIGKDSPGLREAPGFIVSILQAHNGYLDVRLETGLIGIGVLAAVIIAALAQAGRKRRQDPALSWLSLVLVMQPILHNSMESSFFRGFSLMWISFLIGINLSSERAADLPEKL